MAKHHQGQSPHGFSCSAFHNLIMMVDVGAAVQPDHVTCEGQRPIPIEPLVKRSVLWMIGYDEQHNILRLGFPVSKSGAAAQTVNPN